MAAVPASKPKKPEEFSPPEGEVESAAAGLSAVSLAATTPEHVGKRSSRLHDVLMSPVMALQGTGLGFGPKTAEALLKAYGEKCLSEICDLLQGKTNEEIVRELELPANQVTKIMAVIDFLKMSTVELTAVKAELEEKTAMLVALQEHMKAARRDMGADHTSPKLDADILDLIDRFRRMRDIAIKPFGSGSTE